MNGGDVLMTCSFNRELNDISQLHWVRRTNDGDQVVWLKRDDKLLLILDGNNVNESFAEKVEPIEATTRMSQIVLKNVTDEDEAEYLCVHVETGSESHEKDLKVVGEEVLCNVYGNKGKS